jgi:hypothetical protein
MGEVLLQNRAKSPGEFEQPGRWDLSRLRKPMQVKLEIGADLRSKGPALGEPEIARHSGRLELWERGLGASGTGRDAQGGEGLDERSSVDRHGFVDLLRMRHPTTSAL